MSSAKKAPRSLGAYGRAKVSGYRHGGGRKRRRAAALHRGKAHADLALDLRSLASFSMASVCLTMCTEKMSVVGVFWSSSRKSEESWRSEERRVGKECRYGVWWWR